jgi:hypothetical protein
MLWEAAQWVGNFLETVGSVGAVLLIGALVAGAAFWIFRRTVGLIAKPEVDDDPFEDAVEPQAPDQHEVSADRHSPL